MKTILRIFLMVTISLILLSCNDEPQNRENAKDAGRDVEEELIQANKAAVKTEDQQIEDYLLRYKWEMQTSGTGLRYLIDDEGYGAYVKDGDRVTLDYAVKLITGDVIYTSKEDGPLTFTVGQEDVISGLYEGVKLLRNDGKARFIIPSHLAYGLIGDDRKVGPKSTLIYKVHIIEVEH
jgi:gliding motility-associated peptidyl-prolyl isomerase